MKKTKNKLTEVITFRTTKETKMKLIEEAEIRDWTLAQLVERIVSQYTNKEYAEDETCKEEKNEKNM